MVAVRHLVDVDGAPADVDAARATVEALREGLPDTLLARRPEELRRLARTALDAERAASRRRSKVGDEPALDEDAAQAVVDAHAAVREARAGVSSAASDAVRLLAAGNAWGLAGLAVAGALVFRGVFEPMAAPVSAAVIGAATGPLVTSLLGLSIRSVATARLRSASAAWATLVDASGFDTYGALCARRVAREGWKRRREEADAATALAREARAAWHRAAGPRVHPREAPRLIAQMAVLRAAQLQLLEALLARRTEQCAAVEEHAPRPSVAPPVLDRVRSFGLRLWIR